MNSLRQLALSALSLLVLAFVPVGTVSAQQVKVTAADPASAYQGTVSLDVTINGSGFDNSAQAAFLVNGTTNPGGITVTKTVFKSSRQVVATITVADTAVVGAFDIEVILSTGRKGKGTTLFAVQSKSSDACSTTGLDFPAFAYVKSAGTTQQVHVADATGACTRPLFLVTDGYGAGPSLSFVYPVAGDPNRGRVVWLEGSQVVGGDFTVSGTNVTLETRRTLVSGIDCCALTLNPTGEHLYVSTAQGTLSKVSVASPGDRTVIKQLSDDGWFPTATVNGDESALYVDEQRAQGTEFGLRQLIRIDLVSLTSTVLDSGNVSHYWPAADPQSDRVAYTHYVVGSDNCYLLQIVDGATGSTISYGQPAYGRGATWVAGNILSNGYSAPSRRNKCSGTDDVTQLDPTTGAQTRLFSGYDPDGR